MGKQRVSQYNARMDNLWIRYSMVRKGTFVEDYVRPVRHRSVIVFPTRREHTRANGPYDFLRSQIAICILYPDLTS